jgi:hypothetical protein
MRNQKSVYFDDERLERILAIQREMSAGAGVNVGISAVLNRAIDDLFLINCPLETTIISDERPEEPTHV